jgi:hypothetical protein
MPVSIINLCGVEVENTHTIIDRKHMMMIATGTHIILLFDETTTFARILKAREVLKDMALSVKVVDVKFENQYLVSLKDFDK